MSKIQKRRRGGYDYAVALEVGINAAIVFEKIAYFLSEKARQDKHFHDGHYWFYATYDDLAEKIGVLSVKQVRNAINSLIANDYLIVGHFSFGKVNRTTWYTVPEDKMTEIYPEFEYELPQECSAQKDLCFAQKDECSYQKGRTNNNELPVQHTVQRRKERENKIKERQENNSNAESKPQQPNYNIPYFEYDPYTVPF